MNFTSHLSSLLPYKRAPLILLTSFLTKFFKDVDCSLWSYSRKEAWRRRFWRGLCCLEHLQAANGEPPKLLILQLYSFLPFQVAVKVVEKSGAGLLQLQVLLPRELAILSKLKNSHPNICQLHYVEDSPSHVYIVQKLAVNGDLGDYVSARGGRLPEAEGRWAMSQLCSAVDYLHKEGIVHRDIKVENVLVDEGMRIVLAGK